MPVHIDCVAVLKACVRLRLCATETGSSRVKVFCCSSIAKVVMKAEQKLWHASGQSYQCMLRWVLQHLQSAHACAAIFGTETSQRKACGSFILKHARANMATWHWSLTCGVHLYSLVPQVTCMQCWDIIAPIFTSQARAVK